MFPPEQGLIGAAHARKAETPAGACQELTWTPHPVRWTRTPGLFNNGVGK